MKRSISEALKIREKKFAKTNQRSELLARNEIFNKELEEIKNIIGEEFFKLKDVHTDDLRQLPEYKRILSDIDYPKIKLEIHPSIKVIGRGLIVDVETSQKDPVLEVFESMQESSKEKESHKLVEAVEDVLNDNPFKSKLMYELLPISFVGKKRNLNTIYILKPRPKNKPTHMDRLIVLERYKQKWKEFCDKWHIKYGWHGDFSRLYKFQKSLIQISVDTKNLHLPISIKIGPWTSKKDIDKKFREIKELQKSIIYKEEESSNFARDLCWYDLSQKGLKPREIAELWIRKYPEEIDEWVAQKIIKKYPIFKEVSVKEFLDEIRSGNSQVKEARDDFKEEKELYTTGQTEHGKFTPRFIDKIKKAIKSMDERIKRANLLPKTGNNIIGIPVKKEK